MKSTQNKVTVVSFFNPDQIGYQDFRYRVETLKRAGLLDQVVCNIPEAREELGIDESEFKLVPGGVGGILTQWSYYIKLMLYCLRKRKSHVFLLHSFLAPVACLLPKVKTYLYWNEHPSHFIGKASGGLLKPLKWSKGKISLYLFYQGARSATLVMPIGEHHMEDIIEAGCSPENVALIYMGVGAEFRSAIKRTVKNDALRLVYTGSVMEDRGRDIMLEAVCLCQKNRVPVYLSIIGADREQIRIIREAVKTYNIEKNIDVMGRVSGSEIPGYLERADFGICLWADKPYWRFNPPTKLFEYLVAGIPIIANDMRTHTKYIVDGVNGYICRYSSESLSEVLINAWNKKAEYPAMVDRVCGDNSKYLWSTIEPQFLREIQKHL